MAQTCQPTSQGSRPLFGAYRAEHCEQVNGALPMRQRPDQLIRALAVTIVMALTGSYAYASRCYGDLHAT
jgi:hypothetical protein